MMNGPKWPIKGGSMMIESELSSQPLNLSYHRKQPRAKSTKVPPSDTSSVWLLVNTQQGGSSLSTQLINTLEMLHFFVANLFAGGPIY